MGEACTIQHSSFMRAVCQGSYNDVIPRITIESQFEESLIARSFFESFGRKRQRSRVSTVFWPLIEVIGKLNGSLFIQAKFTKPQNRDRLGPHRNPMPPPDLAADAPILQAGHPMVIDLRPAVGVEFHLAIGHDGLAFLHARVFEEPLLAQAALDGHVGTLGVA